MLAGSSNRSSSSRRRVVGCARVVGHDFLQERLRDRNAAHFGASRARTACAVPRVQHAARGHRQRAGEIVVGSNQPPVLCLCAPRRDRRPLGRWTRVQHRAPRPLLRSRRQTNLRPGTPGRLTSLCGQAVCPRASAAVLPFSTTYELLLETDFCLSAAASIADRAEQQPPWPPARRRRAQRFIC